MRNYFLLFVAIVLLTGCKQSFKRGQNGLEYKVISTGSGSKLKMGDFMQMHMTQYYNNGKIDSVLTDTRITGGVIIDMLDTLTTPKAYYEIITQMRKGDSLVIRSLTDSIFAKFPERMPPYFKKGNYLITTIKMENILKSREAADSARKAEYTLMNRRDSFAAIAQMAKDDKILNEFFKKNNITNLQKGAQGTYVQISSPGTGPLIDENVVAKVNYTGRTLDGKMFDSNTDPSKGHVEPYKVNMTDDTRLGGAVIKGWYDGLKLLNKGAKGKIFIPSPLAYGKSRQTEEIVENSILVFDIEILDIISREAATVDYEAMVKNIKEKQKRYRDSIAKVKPDSSVISKMK